jgi:hypothetical protein
VTTLLKDGVIRDPVQPSTALHTAKIQSWRSAGGPPDEGNLYIFAVSENYELNVAPDGDRKAANAVKHETLFHNEDVLAAGEIYIANGVVQDINDASGSYGTRGALETDPKFADAVLKALTTHGLPVDAVLLEHLRQLKLT